MGFKHYSAQHQGIAVEQQVAFEYTRTVRHCIVTPLSYHQDIQQLLFKRFIMA
ncbi:Uncharacterised protein [Serratia marcescens]|nr:Uncharacterised protein [Serratia marcescens]CAI1502246.1 Uncharacterised protein [Serratia marcescens]CUZ82170.1 Uncharacterised protein [Serratia marcescens]CVE91319.1 Uncharacterised protein [Serratia marcescens]CVG47204.1 Uncharacterised protein [Serratia marcescens]